MKKTNCPYRPPVRPRVELSDRTRLVPIPGLKAPVGPAEARFSHILRGQSGLPPQPSKAGAVGKGGAAEQAIFRRLRRK